MSSVEAPDEFPREVHQSVEGLLYLGHLEDRVEFCGHSFTIRTLKGDEELMVGLLTKEHTDTLSSAKAWAYANVALALSAVDDDPDFCPPLGPDRASAARARFAYVTSNWYWPVIEYIFARYANLVNRQAKAMEALQDLSTRNLRTSMALADSSTDKAASPDA